MGLFDRLFGKGNKAKKDAKERRALGLKDDAELAKEVTPPAPKAETKPVAPKAETKPTAPKAETKPAAPKAEAKPAAPKAETKPVAPKAEAKSEAPKTEKKATAPQAKKATTKAEEKPIQRPTEAEEAEADTIAETAETVEVNDVGAGGASGRFEIKKSKDGRFVFNLYAKNHVIVATSQIYSSSTSAVNGIKSVITNAPIAAVEDQTLKTYEPQNFPKWEIYQDKGGQYRFRLNASNGSCICHSQGYTSKASCKNGIESIIRTAKDAEIDKSYLKKD